LVSLDDVVVDVDESLFEDIGSDLDEEDEDDE